MSTDSNSSNQLPVPVQSTSSPLRAIWRGLRLSPVWRRRLWVSVLILLGASSGYQLFALTHMQRILGPRALDAASHAQAAQALAQSARVSVQTLQARQNELEEQLASTRSQQTALEQHYRELIQQRDEALLVEIEQNLQNIAQQLQLNGNLAHALTALQNMDARLARNTKPQYLPIRKALATDIGRLQALVARDLPGLAYKLDQMIANVDKLALLIDPPAEPFAAPISTTNRPADAKHNPAPAESAWAQRWITMQTQVREIGSRFTAQLAGLIRIHEVERPDALLLSPAQGYFLRESLKLRLLNARLSLLARNDALFRADLGQAQNTLAQYFDSRQRPVQAAQEQLKALVSTPLSIDPPNLAASLAAVRQAGTWPR